MMKGKLVSSIYGMNPRLVSSLVLATLIISACAPAAATAPPPPTLAPPAEPTAMPTTAPTVEPTTVPATTPDAPPTTAPTPAPSIPPTPAFEEPTLAVATDPKLGPILVGDNGMTLYIFTKDEPSKSNCDAECLKNWPPLLTQGNPSLGEGVDASLVGTATLADGSIIVTYNKMPLYYWYKDNKPGDTTGEGVGEVWYVLSPVGMIAHLQIASQPPNPMNENNKEDKDTDY